MLEAFSTLLKIANTKFDTAQNDRYQYPESTENNKNDFHSRKAKFYVTYLHLHANIHVCSTGGPANLRLM